MDLMLEKFTAEEPKVEHDLLMEEGSRIAEEVLRSADAGGTTKEEDYAAVANESPEELDQEMGRLREQVKMLQHEKEQRDEEFGRHRAMFKELYMMKEEEVGQVQQARISNDSQYLKLCQEYEKLQDELAELKSVALIAESSSKEEMENMRRSYLLEVESMEQAMRATIDEALQSTEARFNTERKQLLDANARLKSELDESKRRPSQNIPADKNGLFGSMARRLGGMSVQSPPPSSPPMMHTSASLQTLRSPGLEEEHHRSDATRTGGFPEVDLSTASKGDVEMYFGVLQTQKTVLQEDAANSRRELAKVQKLLEQERDLTRYFRRCLQSSPATVASLRQRSEDLLDSRRTGKISPVEPLDTSKSDNTSERSANGDDSPIGQSPPLLDLDTSSFAGSDDAVLDGSTPSGRRPTLTSITSSASNLANMELLQSETKEALCAMCANYESQLQAAQNGEARLRSELQNSRQAASRLKEDLTMEQQYRTEMDKKITKSVNDTQSQISDLYKSLSDAEKRLQESQDGNHAARFAMEQIMREMLLQREQTSKELAFLEKENGRLTDQYTQEWRKMQEEEINLPTDVEELHHLLLRYREDVIRSRVAKERGEDGLKSEILFLRDQLAAEVRNKEDIVQMLTKETDTLRERIAMADSEKTHVEEQYRTMQNKRLEEEMDGQQMELVRLRDQLTSLIAEKTKLDKDYRHVRSRAQALQVELDNSEAVQRDFVKLSQSLQMELEKIRQAENEVRWQIDEDVDECNQCRQPFMLAKKKVRSLKIHCRHCGKIFCSDCLSKEAPSGPHRRLVKVCDVCHTILNRETAPYFSKSPPSPV